MSTDISHQGLCPLMIQQSRFPSWPHWEKAKVFYSCLEEISFQGRMNVILLINLSRCNICAGDFITTPPAPGSWTLVCIFLYNFSHSNRKICIPSRREGERKISKIKKRGFLEQEVSLSTAFHPPYTHILHSPHWPLPSGIRQVTSGS